MTDNAFFTISPPRLLKALNINMPKSRCINAFLPNCATLFGHYSHFDISRILDIVEVSFNSVLRTIELLDWVVLQRLERSETVGFELGFSPIAGCLIGSLP